MKSRIKLVGVDLGFGFTKGFDGQRAVIMPSILAENGRPPATSPVAHPLIEEDLHLAFEDATFFAGNRADCDWLSPQVPRQAERLFGDYGRRLVLAVLATYTEMETPLMVVIGLPVSHYQRLKDVFETRLIGYHKVAWVRPDGSRVPKNVHIRKIRTVPHPMGTYSGLIMNAEGRMRADMFKDQKTIVVDIGFRTTNVITMDRMRFSNRYSGTIALGISRGFEQIAHKLKAETGRSPSFDQLYQAVRLGSIHIDGQHYKIERVRREAFSRLAEQLADNIGYLLSAAWDIDSLLLTGGGSRDLAEYIGPLLPGEVSQIENEQDVRLNNVQGQLRLARSFWGASGFCEQGG